MKYASLVYLCTVPGSEIEDDRSEEDAEDRSKESCVAAHSSTTLESFTTPLSLGCED